MRLIKSLIVAFSLYSRIPMPRFNWDSEDMKYHFIFFPLVGGIIGIIEYLWFLFCNSFQVSKVVFALIALFIPLFITGGFHVDGYMDTSDALSSYQDKKRRLEILKDPHIGAFSVIRICGYGLLLLASVYTMDDNGFLAWIFMFFISRAVSGICAINYKKAKGDGSLVIEVKTAHEKLVNFVLAIELIMVGVLAGALFQTLWTMALVGLIVAILYYLYIAFAKFDGITGDLAGWFVCEAELFSAIAIAAFTILSRR